MPHRFESGALLGQSFQLPAGPRVRLRLARPKDRGALAQLLERRGVAADALAVERLVRFDPTRQVVICATAPLGGGEAIVGVGACELGDEAEPDTLVVDERVTEGLGQLLTAALAHRCAARARRVA